MEHIEHETLEQFEVFKCKTFFNVKAVKTENYYFLAQSFSHIRKHGKSQKQSMG